MNLQEQADVVRTAAIIRTARKLRGKTQLEVADHLGVSQSYLSKLENGHLIPSSSQWFSFCRLTHVNPAKTFEMGIIDHGFPLGNETQYLNALFRVHSKYTQFAATKVRAIFPFIHYFIQQLGEAEFHAYCKDQFIDPDFFRVFDIETNFAMLLDLVQTLMERGCLRSDDLTRLLTPISSPSFHGCLHEDYDQTSSAKGIICHFVQNSAKYEMNFLYQIEDKKENHLTLSVRPNQFLNHFNYRDKSLGNFFCQYQKGYFKHLSSYGGKHPLATVHEKQCHYQGHDKCIYEITVE
jgi:transcriptional regulator with XRE-family HTH domain